jgi:hypothetical protein
MKDLFVIKGENHDDERYTYNNVGLWIGVIPLFFICQRLRDGTFFASFS